MNKDDLIKKLENLDLPEVGLPSHQRRLKTALLNSGYWKEKITMNRIKQFAPIGVVAIVAVLVIGVLLVGQQPSSTAYARELVKKSAETLAGSNAVPLPTAVTCTIEDVPKGTSGTTEIKDGKCVIQWARPDDSGVVRDEKDNIIFITTAEGKLVPAPHEIPAASYTFTKESFFDSLKEAKQAEDLTYLGDKRVGDPSKPLSAIGRTIKILRFTDEKGSTTILGIDENNYLVVRLAYTKDGGVMFGSGAINGQTPPRFNLEEAIKYWTENLEQPIDFKAIQK